MSFIPKQPVHISRPQKSHKRKRANVNAEIDRPPKIAAQKDKKENIDTKTRLEKFIQNYRGQDSLFFGHDNPGPYKTWKCSIILSTESKSIILDTEDHVLRFKYDCYSQNTGIEIRVGDMIPKQEYAPEEGQIREILVQPSSNREFRTLYSLPIYTEQMDGLPLRTTFKEANVSKMKSALVDFDLPNFNHTDEELTTFVEVVKNKWDQNSIDFLRINVEPGNIKVRHMCGVTKSQICGQLLAYFHDIRSLTVVRRGANDEERLYDDLWDYFISRCIKDGIHWAYDLERPAKDEHGEDTAFPEAVLKGLAKAPYIRWMPDGGARNTWPKKAGFTSMEDLRSRLIITLLQNFSRQKYAHDMLYRFNKTFLRHDAFVERDTILTDRPRHFDLHVVVTNPSGRRLPEVLSDTMVTIRQTLDDEGNIRYQELEGRVVERPKLSRLTSDFVLDVLWPEGYTSWGRELKQGQRLKVRLELQLDIAKAREQLQDITNICENATEELRNFFFELSSHAEAAEENFDWEAIRKLLRSGNLESGVISFTALKSVFQLAMEEIRQAELRVHR